MLTVMLADQLADPGSRGAAGVGRSAHPPRDAGRALAGGGLSVARRTTWRERRLEHRRIASRVRRLRAQGRSPSCGAIRARSFRPMLDGDRLADSGISRRRRDARCSSGETAGRIATNSPTGAALAIGIMPELGGPGWKRRSSRPSSFTSSRLLAADGARSSARWRWRRTR